jgi:hypothetical protein
MYNVSRSESIVYILPIALIDEGDPRFLEVAHMRAV